MNYIRTIVLIFLAAVGCLSAAAGRVDAVFNAEGGGPGFGGNASYEADRVFAGKYAYSLQLPDSGEAVLLSTPIAVGESVDSLSFSGFFTTDGGNAEVSVEFQLMDRYGHVFEPTNAMPIPGSATKLIKAVNPGDRVISVDRSARWTPSPDAVVTFSAPEDGRDLPNINCAAPGIAAVRDTGYAMEVKLTAPVTAAYSAGPVRLHRLTPLAPPVSNAKLAADDFRQIAGTSSCGVGAAYIRLKLIFRGTPHSRIIFDDVTMTDVPVAVVPVAGRIQPNPAKQREIMDFYADRGYELDRIYAATGMKLDTAAMRGELSGGSAAAEISKESWRKSDELRARYLKLSEQLENLVKSNSLMNSEVFAQRKAIWELEFSAFRNACGELSATAKTGEPAPAAKPFSVQPDYLFTRFIRGIDIGYKFYGANRLKHPGNEYDPEYIALAFNRAGINLVSLEVIRDHNWRDFVGRFNSVLTCPILPWSTDPVFDGGDSNSYSYFGNISTLEADAGRCLAEFSQFDRVAGLQLDEPVALDNSSYGVFYRNRAVMNEWSSYAQALNAALAREKIKNGEVSPRRPELELEGANRIPYWAWQFFKKEYMGRHLGEAYKALTADGKLVSTVLIDWNASTPQATSFVSSASQLPYVGTDLYNDGSISESFSMQLLRSAAMNRAIMWPGAGYSCKSAAAFARSLAVGLAYGDGLHVWTYEYCGKYRDPNIFWKYGAEAVNLDDRNRLMFQNWSPDLWSTLEKYYRTAIDAGDSLTDARPKSGLALLFSERQAIMADNPREYYDRQVGLYSASVAGNVPCAVEFIECLTPEKLADYKIILVANLEIMSDEDCAMLKKFVTDGGVLVTFGEIATFNQWGVPVRGGALASLLGTKFSGMGFSGSGSCETPFGTVSADRNIPMLKLSAQASAKRYLWDTFGVALTENHVGSGVCYSFALPAGGFSSQGYGFYPGLDRFIANLAKKYAPAPVTLENLPPGVEVAIKHNDRSELVVVLINRTGMFGGKVTTVSGHKIKLTSGKPFAVRVNSWSVKVDSGAVELPDFSDSQLLILKPL